MHHRMATSVCQLMETPIMFGPIRALQHGDFDIRTIEGDGPRMLLAFTFQDQDGGYAADAATLLAMAPDIDTLVDVVTPLVQVQVETPDIRPGSGFQMPPVLRVGCVSRRGADEGPLSLDETLMVVSAPVSAGLALDLTVDALLTLPQLEPGLAPRP